MSRMTHHQPRGHGRQGDPPPAPAPLAVPILDSHTHLDIVGIDATAQIAAAVAVGVDRLVQVGVDVASSRWSAAVTYLRSPDIS